MGPFFCNNKFELFRAYWIGSLDIKYNQQVVVPL